MDVSECLCSDCFEKLTNLNLIGDLINPKIKKIKKHAKKLSNLKINRRIRSCRKLLSQNEICSYKVNEKMPDAQKPDHPLVLWEKILAERNQIGNKIMQQTGKCCCELLFNRITTVNARDEAMLDRILQHAEKMKPSKVKNTLNHNSCSNNSNELFVQMLPRHLKPIEITGLPAVTKKEIIGENCCSLKSKWISSESMKESLQSKREDIKRVVPFFPDIENLQVVGFKKPIFPNDPIIPNCPDQQTMTYKNQFGEMNNRDKYSDLDIMNDNEYYGFKSKNENFCLRIQPFGLDRYYNKNIYNFGLENNSNKIESIRMMDNDIKVDDGMDNYNKAKMVKSDNSFLEFSSNYSGHSLASSESIYCINNCYLPIDFTSKNPKSFIINQNSNTASNCTDASTQSEPICCCNCRGHPSSKIEVQAPSNETSTC